MRLGFPVRAFGVPTRGAADGASPWSARLVHLCDVARYLAAKRIPMYRLDGGLAEAFISLGDRPEEWAQWEAELALAGRLLAEAGVRVSFHPHASVVLNAPDEGRFLAAVGRLAAMARVLDLMGQPAEAVIVLHAGGVYGDAAASMERFARRYDELPAFVRRRLCLENDDRRFGHLAVRRIHELCGIPLVYDNLHHAVLGGGCPELEALACSLGTWPAAVRPKVHYSTPRSEVRGLGGSGRLKMPTWTEHSDLVNPFAFAEFLRRAEGLRPFDVMVEARARDLAVLKLREDLARFAPDVAAREETS